MQPIVLPTVKQGHLSSAIRLLAAEFKSPQLHVVQRCHAFPLVDQKMHFKIMGYPSHGQSHVASSFASHDPRYTLLKIVKEADFQNHILITILGKNILADCSQA